MQTGIFTGAHGRYRWLVKTDGYLWDVVGQTPQVVEGKYVSVTASDSGPLTPSSEEGAQGWRKHGTLAVSPVIVTADQVPTDLYHEWYVFATPTVFDEYEIFVNYSAFSLHSPVAEVLRERFWSQIERISPLSYLAEGDNLIWATSEMTYSSASCRLSSLKLDSRSRLPPVPSSQ